MPTSRRPHADHPHSLKTAVGLLDPVLIRLSNHRGHLLLLAQVENYEHAGDMRLQQVRWLRAGRRLRGTWGRYTRSASGALDAMILHIGQHYVAANIPAQPCVRVAKVPEYFSTVHLTRDQFLEMRAQTARRFIDNALSLTHAPFPRKAPSRRLLRTARIAKAAVIATVTSLQRLAYAPLRLTRGASAS